MGTTENGSHENAVYAASYLLSSETIIDSNNVSTFGAQWRIARHFFDLSHSDTTNLLENLLPRTPTTNETVANRILYLSVVCSQCPYLPLNGSSQILG